ncbi:enoyl reductase [Colletotrichum tabaci]|uniref:Enoyl reductase n=1 Tax=Colletotrichum tabaci TaxID=1209068 RepID=A0AAV9TSH7_9PEZI
MGSLATEAAFTPPAKQRAMTVNDNDEVVIWDDAPCPKLPADQVYVRVDAVALNPSDTKMRGAFATPWAFLGTDYCGTVVAVGSGVTHVRVGDRVYGAQNEMCPRTPDQGAFAQYTITRGGIWAKVPDGWATEAAAALPAGISTAGLALKLLGIPLPYTSDGAKPVKTTYVLVYGGSTATATITMQFLRESGYVPIAVCSPHNFELAKRNGAEEVFDYHDSQCAETIRAFTKNNLRYALDCITNVESTTACFKAIGRAGGRYVSLNPFPEHAATRKMVTTDWTLGPTIFGEGSTWPAPYGREGSDEEREFGALLWRVAGRLVEEGKLRHHPLRVIHGGFEQVKQSMEVVRAGELSGEKIVVVFER